ncbi:hypothetical protein X798_04139 [Onchocerca flexuosa]|uniref:Uncharacterized protein n=1 Tax=Onchocerca flexuosa TaxID=387005 RepID=A0A238BUZ5_9BILA|nr:hypothetical protein X798_04139 [Onchocerca flexuosa]
MNNHRLGKIQKGEWLTDSTTWSSRPNRVSRMRHLKTAEGKTSQKSRNFQDGINSDNVSLLSQRIKKAYCDEYSDDAEYDESDGIYDNDYLDNDSNYLDEAYDGQAYNDNDGYHEYFGYHSRYPLNPRYVNEMEQVESDEDISFPTSFLHPVSASEKIPHMLPVLKPSSSKISPNPISKPTKIAVRKRTAANNCRKIKTKNITTKVTSTTPRAMPSHSIE